jgi:hypothetical protein
MKSFLYRQLALFSSTKTKVFILCGLVIVSSILSLVFSQMPAEGNAQSTQTESRDTAPAQAAPPQSSSSSNSAAAPNTPIVGPQTSQQTAQKKVPVYHSADFLAGYLSNQASSIIVEGKPWINASTNVAQYQEPLGGNSFWDYWGESEKWDSTNDTWRDDRGAWHLYSKHFTQQMARANGDILVDRDGPG